MEMYNSQPFQNSHSRWRAVTQRDPSAHGSFLYGVTSTKIYCRPTCIARLARRANVVFYDSVDQARQDGYRACQRCKPDDQQFFGDREEIVIRALGLLKTKRDTESMEGGLKQLAKEVGVTPSYLCRVFKKTMGMTIGAYIKEFQKAATPAMTVRSGTTESLSTARTPVFNATEESTSLIPNAAAPMGPLEADSEPAIHTSTGSGMATTVPHMGTWNGSDIQMISGFNAEVSNLALPTSFVTTSSAPAPVEDWRTAPIDPASQLWQEFEEPLDLDFDCNEWLWAEGFDFNAWMASTQVGNINRTA